MLKIIISILGAYLVGALPIGYLLARFYGIDDIRRYGSGVIGATNVSRVLGLKYFFIVLFLDVLKAYVYLMVCSSLLVPKVAILVSAFALLIGNSYSIFLRGSGGKGVATFIGIMLVLNQLLCIMALITWLSVFYFVRTVGIASIITALLLPLYALLFTDMYGFLFIIISASWIIWRHRMNIHLFYGVR